MWEAMINLHQNVPVPQNMGTSFQGMSNVSPKSLTPDVAFMGVIREERTSWCHHT